jgi:hypothetical protein
MQLCAGDWREKEHDREMLSDALENLTGFLEYKAAATTAPGR